MAKHVKHVGGAKKQKQDSEAVKMAEELGMLIAPPPHNPHQPTRVLPGEPYPSPFPRNPVPRAPRTRRGPRTPMPDYEDGWISSIERRRREAENPPAPRRK